VAAVNSAFTFKLLPLFGYFKVKDCFLAGSILFRSYIINYWGFKKAIAIVFGKMMVKNKY
jgi:hypothetical protein